MKSWKAALGLGTACAVCCAIPLLGIAGGLAATGSALLACADDLLPPAAALLAIALAVTTVWWWRRRQASRSAACGCADTCPTKVPHVSN